MTLILACEQAQDHYTLSDAYENPLIPDDIQREGPEDVNVYWESVRDEVAGVKSVNGFRLVRVVQMGLEAFENAFRRRETTNTVKAGPECGPECANVEGFAIVDIPISRDGDVARIDLLRPIWAGRRWFLRSCFLERSAARSLNADPKNLAKIPLICLWLSNVLPGHCWGSYAKVAVWQKARAKDRAEWKAMLAPAAAEERYDTVRVRGNVRESASAQPRV
ncbi:MAG: hypothetical protein H0W20_12950 [Chthoniobacterales bacterium]|nr:hypothetical protein [Chthoniobacterales bacterium]